MISPDAEVVLRQIREMRARGSSVSQRDLEFIDAEYDRRVRRIHNEIDGKSAASAFPLLRTMYVRSCVKLRRRVRFRV